MTAAQAGSERNWVIIEVASCQVAAGLNDDRSTLDTIMELLHMLALWCPHSFNASGERLKMGLSRTNPARVYR